jgi:hypothetical protein
VLVSSSSGEDVYEPRDLNETLSEAMLTDLERPKRGDNERGSSSLAELAPEFRLADSGAFRSGRQMDVKPRIVKCLATVKEVVGGSITAGKPPTLLARAVRQIRSRKICGRLIPRPECDCGSSVRRGATVCTIAGPKQVCPEQLGPGVDTESSVDRQNRTRVA